MLLDVDDLDANFIRISNVLQLKLEQLVEFWLQAVDIGLGLLLEALVGKSHNTPARTEDGSSFDEIGSFADFKHDPLLVSLARVHLLVPHVLDDLHLQLL
eukprot:CAMPEP_0170549852 /NCGR_PEP_ID=MMETSP0211-20121228/7978_1 /TAXON_ID=311385 /ORGANISM="Pseudokeronopsis sp., Strain OXSARD2" /LENGTH=99 /DNA_ID=CAMNT_0010856101 /DNA_START=717 /DNA_END=1016 /DNA_ORIENTATION=+